MAQTTWITPAGTLAEINEGKSYTKALVANDTDFTNLVADATDVTCDSMKGTTDVFLPLVFTVIAGSLPTGIITPGSTCNLVSFTNTHFGIDPAFYLEWQDVLQIGARIYVGDNGQQWFIDAVAFDGGGCNSPTTLIYVVSTQAEADGNPNTNTPGVNVNAVVWTSPQSLLYCSISSLNSLCTDSVVYFKLFLQTSYALTSLGS